jgi:hypothetical protein
VNKTNPYCKSYILNSFSYIIYCYYSLLLWYVGKEFKTYRSFVANIFGIENPKRPRQSKKKDDDDDDDNDDDDDDDRVRKKGRGSTPPNSPAPRTSPSSSPRTSPPTSSGTSPGTLTSPRSSPTNTSPPSKPSSHDEEKLDDNGARSKEEELNEELNRVKQLLEEERQLLQEERKKNCELQKVPTLVYSLQPNSYLA